MLVGTNLRQNGNRSNGNPSVCASPVPFVSRPSQKPYKARYIPAPFDSTTNASRPSNAPLYARERAEALGNKGQLGPHDRKRSLLYHLRRIEQDIFEQFVTEDIVRVKEGQFRKKWRAVCDCGKKPLPDQLVTVSAPRIKTPTGEKIGPAYFHGLVRCGSSWVCPTCAVKIGVERSKDFRRMIEAAKEQGMSVYFFTATIRHHAGHRLAELLEALQETWRFTFHGREYRAFKERIGWVGMGWTLEVTFGKNGPHPHKHGLIFTDRPLSNEERKDAARWIFQRMRDRLVEKHGLPETLEDYAVKLEPLTTVNLGRYLAKTGVKIGLELALGQTNKEGSRGGRTPFQVLADYFHTGEDRHLSLWIEFVRAIHDQPRWFVSGHLRKRLGLAPFKEDRKLVNESDQERLIHIQVTRREWYHLFYRDIFFRLRILSLCDEGQKEEAVRLVEDRMREAGRKSRMPERGRPRIRDDDVLRRTV